MAICASIYACDASVKPGSNCSFWNIIGVCCLSNILKIGLLYRPALPEVNDLLSELARVLVVVAFYDKVAWFDFLTRSVV